MTGKTDAQILQEGFYVGIFNIWLEQKNLHNYLQDVLGLESKITGYDLRPSGRSNTQNGRLSSNADTIIYTETELVFVEHKTNLIQRLQPYQKLYYANQFVKNKYKKNNEEIMKKKWKFIHTGERDIAGIVSGRVYEAFKNGKNKEKMKILFSNVSDEKVEFSIKSYKGKYMKAFIASKSETYQIRKNHIPWSQILFKMREHLNFDEGMLYKIMKNNLI